MLQRVFSKREKILLVILAVLILAAAYYFLVEIPVSEVVPTADATVDALTLEGDVLQAKYDRMLSMQAELEKLKDSDKAVEIPQYDNLPDVISFLNAILSGMKDYEAQFNDAIIGEDNIARRRVSLSFTAPSYKAATDAVAALQDCPFLCRVDTVNITPTDYYRARSYETVTSSKSLNVKVSILYYETM